jgi:DNA-binding MarR family transcriptional regulator
VGEAVLLPADLEIIHQPARLKLMTLLYRHGDVGFTEAQRSLDLTPGNLDAHQRKLAGEGLLEARKALLRTGFEVRLKLTPAGADRFQAYLDWLDSFMAAARESKRLLAGGRPP